ncbi:MAG: nucleoside-diphosphate kinase [Chloroflexi bacterium]|nr:nucleoside-diphosphate kinase [Chloroflexota bacterium]
MERTLVLIKPDAMQRGLAGEIILRWERRGLKIVAMKMIHMSQALAEEHYSVHRGKTFFPGLIGYITSYPIIAAVLEGHRAVEAVRQTMGATDPLNAVPGSIRGDLSLDIGRNLVHGSDSAETAAREISLFFSPQEIFSAPRDIDPWVFEEQKG